MTEGDGDRHPLAQRVVGIGDHNTQAINQIGAQIRRLHGFRREFSGRGNEADFAAVGFIRATIGVKQPFATPLGLAEFFFIDIGAYSHRMG